MTKSLTWAMCILPLVTFAYADEPDPFLDGLELTGQIAIEPRWFVEDPAFPGQFEGVQLSGFIEPELSWRSESGDYRATFTPFYRLDSRDDERTHFDIREAYVQKIGDDWDLLIGANRVFWGVAESRHLVNIVNQIDSVEDINEEDFLGQPMVQFGYQTDYGRFGLFLMTGFRERTFPGPDGRLRGPLPVGTERALFESSLEEWRPDVAFRYTHFLDELDIGFHVFHGTSREPDFLLSPSGTELLPRYSVINQVGADLQYTKDAWLWKFEGLVREGQGDTFAAAVAGFEYTLFQVMETDADLGFLVEGLYDGRDEDPGVFPTVFDQDIFFGSRLALNDVQDTAILAGLVIDVENGLGSFRIEAERRLGDSFKLEVEIQGFLEDDDDDPSSVFQDDSFATVRLSWFF